MATEVKQRNNRVLLLLGVVLAAAGVAVTLYIGSRGSSNTSSSSSAPPVQVVYSQVDIPKGTQITQAMLVVKSVPADAVNAQTASDFTQVVGKYASVPISANSAMQTTLLVADSATAQTAALAAQPLTIQAGYVAMTIPCAWPGGDPYRGADTVCISGLIQTDDHIDIMLDPKGDGTVRYGFQDVHVLRAGAPPAAGAAATVPASLVVELPRAQAEELAFLFYGKNGNAGVVRYVLRPRDEYNKGPEGIDQPVPVPGDTTGKKRQPGTPNLPSTPDQPVTPDGFNKLFPTR